MLRNHRSGQGVNKAIRDLISRHGPTGSSAAPDLGSLIRRLSGLKAGESSSINVFVLKVPGNAIFVTEEMIQSLPPYQEAIPRCATDNR